MNPDYEDDMDYDDEPRDDKTCAACSGTGMECDSMPCQQCDGEGYRWWE